jgi:UV DNA damage endonuclease
VVKCAGVPVACWCFAVRIGYPSINWTIGCKADRTFRLRSYSEERLIETVRNNLDCLLEILQFNVAHNILFFRITSDLVPFASHPVCQFDWPGYFRGDFQTIGAYVRAHHLRISMHPGQFVVLNTPNANVLESSLKELEYHAEVLDAMQVDTSARIQVHVGGVYGDKEGSMLRFGERYRNLKASVRRRLVIENDDRSYSLSDCLQVHAEAGVPVLFDVFHHELNGHGETVAEALAYVSPTWDEKDGVPMVDYGYERAEGRRGRHSESIDLKHFRRFLEQSRPFDFDVMLEIKDKETSALKAVEVAKTDERFVASGGRVD